MKVFFINNDGGGFADHIELEDGMTIEAFFDKQMHGQQAVDYLIRVNRMPVARDQVLQDGDRVTMTPTKIAGAAA